MDRFYKIQLIERKATLIGHMVRGETYEETHNPDDVWPGLWNYLSDAAKKKVKQRWAIEKPKLDNARQLKGIFFIEPNDEDFKLTINAVRRKLEVPIPAVMPCTIPIEKWRNPPQHWETQDKIQLCC